MSARSITDTLRQLGVKVQKGRVLAYKPLNREEVERAVAFHKAYMKDLARKAGIRVETTDLFGRMAIGFVEISDSDPSVMALLFIQREDGLFDCRAFGVNPPLINFETWDAEIREVMAIADGTAGDSERTI